MMAATLVLSNPTKGIGPLINWISCHPLWECERRQTRKTIEDNLARVLFLIGLFYVLQMYSPSESNSFNIPLHNFDYDTARKNRVTGMNSEFDFDKFAQNTT